MLVIRDNDFFDAFKNLNTQEELIEAVCDLMTEWPYDIPKMLGGVDHVEIKPNGIYIADIGCNGKNNSFIIVPS